MAPRQTNSVKQHTRIRDRAERCLSTHLWRQLGLLPSVLELLGVLPLRVRAVIAMATKVI